MGFICRTFTVVGGSDEFPLGDTEALRVQRSKACLAKLAEALISCNVGWQLDTKRSQTVTDFTDIPSNGYPNYQSYPGLFFINTISGCKLFLCYFGGELGWASIKHFTENIGIQYKRTSSFAFDCCGIMASMIPDGSDNEFGDPFSNGFMPDDATRLCGTCLGGASNIYSAAYSPKSDRHYKYYVLATPYVFCIYANSAVGADPTLPYVPIYATGRIFGTVFHEETSKNAKYGTYAFRRRTESYEGYAAITSSSLIIDTGGYKRTIYVPAYSIALVHQVDDIFPTAAVSKQDGTWLIGAEGDSVSGYPYYFTYSFCPDYYQICSYFHYKSGTTRWIPIYVAVLSTNLNSYGIIPGDGVKGILDTSLFRCGIGTRGQLYDSGNFICPEDNIGLLLGWDPSNDSTV